MSALANHAFAEQMNGIGNEIVVVDLRDQKAAVSADEARAVASHVPYDQMMVLQPPQLRAPRLSSKSTTATVRKSAPAATACAAWFGGCSRRPARPP